MEKDIDIQQIEFSNSKLFFLRSTASLEESIKEVKRTYKFLKAEVGELKKNNGYLIGNPLLSMLNEAIKFEYKMMSQAMTCRMYQTNMLTNDFIDKAEFIREIKQLHYSTMDLLDAYKKFFTRVSHLQRMTYLRKGKEAKVIDIKRIS